MFDLKNIFLHIKEIKNNFKNDISEHKNHLKSIFFKTKFQNSVELKE